MIAGTSRVRQTTSPEVRRAAKVLRTGDRESNEATLLSAAVALAAESLHERLPAESKGRVYILSDHRYAEAELSEAGRTPAVGLTCPNATGAEFKFGIDAFIVECLTRDCAGFIPATKGVEKLLRQKYKLNGVVIGRFLPKADYQAMVYK